MAIESTRDRIFKEAVLLFAAKGYHGTSMRDLASAAGIKESSLYNHFKGKEAILDAVLEYQLDGFTGAMEAIEKAKDRIDLLTDPVEFWMAGAAVFMGSLPPLNEQVSRILINEMFLNEKCRTFYLDRMRPIQKSLTETILTVMDRKGMIRKCDIKMKAEQYVYFLEGIRIEHVLMMMNGSSEEELNAHMMAHLSLFIDGLRKYDY